MSVITLEKPLPAAAPALPAVPVLAVNAREAALLSPDGEISLLPHARVIPEIQDHPVMLCHAPYTKQRLGVPTLPAFDVLELFAFVHPARFCVPTPAGLARALELDTPQQFEDLPLTLMAAAQALLTDIRQEPRRSGKADLLAIAEVMGLQGKGWNWTPYIFQALGETYDPARPVMAKTSLNVWKHLPEWAEEAPLPPSTHHPVTGEESRQKLAEMLSSDSESRPQQAEYASTLTAAFLPAEENGDVHMVLAEAGTGIGKTAGYLAPASVWTEKNGGTVWVSTYTKNLQRQIDQELDRLYPDSAVKNIKTAVRKGRENYLCLLNLDDMIAGAPLARDPRQALAAGLMARWAEVTKDGDMQGGDFHGWLPGLLGHARTRGLADQRGECIYAACDHYHKCFVERATRKSQRAAIVVANHALVMTRTALAGPSEILPQRYIFDEGHHLFDSADSAFSAHLSGRETSDLRRWILGSEGGKRSRARGLSRRVEDLIAGDAPSETLLQDIVHTAHTLAGPDWRKRIKDGQPHGATEEFLHLVGKQVLARSEANSGPYSLETHIHPLIDGLGDAAHKLRGRLTDLQKPMRALAVRLRRRLEENAATLDTDTRKRIDSVCAGLERRAENTIGGWIAMLKTLQQGNADPAFVDWMEVERTEGKMTDIGLYRHWVDPMTPFAAALKPHAHGIVITSATLCDRTEENDEDWRTACRRTGAVNLSDAPIVFSAPSPYDYAAQTRVFIVTDVRKDDIAQVSAAFRVLFESAGGGALGLFTAIQRLRAVQERIAGPLEESHIALYAQHVDVMDTGTLVDIFRADRNACLLGTDAVRDGIDIPGDALRLLVYDRVPWPRPTILHKARQDLFGKQAFDDMSIRLKLRQAYGRLIRRATDRGVFVMLDSMLPSRLLGAFPEGVEVSRLGLADAVARTRDFLQGKE